MIARLESLPKRDLTFISFVSVFCAGLCVLPYVNESGVWWFSGYAGACAMFALFARPLFQPIDRQPVASSHSVSLTVEPDGQFTLAGLDTQPIQKRPQAASRSDRSAKRLTQALVQLDLLTWRKRETLTSKMLTENCDLPTVERVHQACLAHAVSQTDAHRIDLWFSAIRVLKGMNPADYRSTEQMQRAACSKAGLGWETARKFWKGRYQPLEQLVSQVPSSVFDPDITP